MFDIKKWFIDFATKIITYMKGDETMEGSLAVPFESTINTAIEKISDGIITKMDHAEERRNREFTYQLKELDFYKSAFQKDLKDIFDYWFDVVRITHIKGNAHLTEQERQKYEKTYSELMSTDKISKYKMNTLKYGGTETGRVLAVMNGLNQKEYSDKPASTDLFVWCAVLAVLKKEILGQDLDPTDIIRVLVNDFDENVKELNGAKSYVKKYYKKIYGEDPFWIK